MPLRRMWLDGLKREYKGGQYRTRCPVHFLTDWGWARRH